MTVSSNADRSAGRPRRLAVVMDPIESISFKKDSTLAMLLVAQQRGWSIDYLQPADLDLRDGRAWGRGRPLHLYNDPERWFSFASPPGLVPLDYYSIILMRKDPPFDIAFLHTTYLLERAEVAGARVVNRAASLRDANEKLFTAWFSDCCPPTVVTRDAATIRQFLAEEGEIILKPLDGMGGASIFRVATGDPNLSVIIETITGHGSRHIMAQRYLPEIAAGDKRILLIGGEPFPYALARIPAAGESRGNLAAGGRGVGVELSERDRWICERVGPELRRRGLDFVGIDVIGDYLTEINVTSPTCIRELDAIYGDSIADRLFDYLEGTI
jgi:glutathione synthase